MGAIAGTGTSFNLPNYVGELHSITPTETPLLSILGGIGNGKVNTTKEDVWQTYDLKTTEQRASLEGADPDYAGRTRSEVSNVKQIFQYGFSTTYTKQAAVGNLGPSPAATAILGAQPVQDELGFQRSAKLMEMARDVEFSILNGTYAKPSDNTTPRKMRGISTAITTNATAVGGALTKSAIDTLLQDMFDNGSKFRMPLIMVNSFQKLQLSNIYGYAPESRTVGGVRIDQLETDFAGTLGVVLNRHVTSSELLVLDIAELSTTYLAIPGKGLVFVEPKPSTGSAWNFQLYGEIGLEYGPELCHGKLTGLTTS